MSEMRSLACLFHVIFCVSTDPEVAVRRLCLRHLSLLIWLARMNDIRELESICKRKKKEKDQEVTLNSSVDATGWSVCVCIDLE